MLLSETISSGRSVHNRKADTALSLAVELLLLHQHCSCVLCVCGDEGTGRQLAAAGCSSEREGKGAWACSVASL